MKVPSIVQIVLGSDNLPLCKHPYGTAFGSAGAGKRPICSKHNGQAMGFGPQGARVLCMVGRQELLQLEFWTRRTPPQRPLPSEWRLNGTGFCRPDSSVPEFPGTLGRLAAWGPGTLTPATEAARQAGQPALDGCRTVLTHRRRHVVGANAHHMKTPSIPFEPGQRLGYAPEPQRWWLFPCATQADKLATGKH